MIFIRNIYTYRMGVILYAKVVQTIRKFMSISGWILTSDGRAPPFFSTCAPLHTPYLTNKGL